jgi:D-inositol-3-phosphate glycosyltransferase
MIWLYGADPARIEVIPCGVDVSLFHRIPRDEAKAYLEMPEHHRMVLFVGRIEPLKGIDVLMEAMALVLEQMHELRDEICLCIIGGDPDAGVDDLDQEMSRLQQMREQLGIDEVVTFLGKKAQDALPYHYSAAEVCVVPSHYESFGLEAMACGTPVIASKVGGLTFTVREGQTGFLVPSDDPRALADRLRLLLADEKLRRAMGRQAIQRCQKYSWSVVASQVVAAYRNLVAHARARVCCSDGDELGATRASCCE